MQFYRAVNGRHEIAYGGLFPGGGKGEAAFGAAYRDYQTGAGQLLQHLGQVVIGNAQGFGYFLRGAQAGAPGQIVRGVQGYGGGFRDLEYGLHVRGGSLNGIVV